MVIGTLETDHPIGIAMIAIDNTALTIKIGNITSQTVSPQLGTLVRIALPMMLANGKIKDGIRVPISLISRIDRKIKVISGIRAHLGLKVIKTYVKASCQQPMHTFPIMVIIDHPQMEICATTVSQITIFNHLCLLYQVS